MQATAKDQLQVEAARPISRAARERIAARLRQSAAKGANAARIAPRSSPDHPVPVSFAQQRLWILDQLDPGQPVYNVPCAVHLRGPLNPELLQESLSLIVLRHETLRTHLEPGKDGPLQVVNQNYRLDLVLEDLSAVTSSQGSPGAACNEETRLFNDASALAREEELRSRMLAHAALPFQLHVSPLIRAKLFRLEPEHHVLLLVIHHVAWDSWSEGILLEELVAAYTAGLRGESAKLPELEVQYADFSQWQRSAEREEKLQKHLAYWRNQLAGAPHHLELPTDRPRPPLMSTRGGIAKHGFRPGLQAQLGQLAQAEQSSLFMVLLAAFQVLLHRYAGQKDILIGTPVACREHPATERLIGCFQNTLVVRGTLTPQSSFREILRAARETVLEGFAHQDLPFEKLVEELQPARDATHTPLFQVMFTQQGAPETYSAGNLRLEVFRFDLDVSPFDLTLYIEQDEDTFSAAAEYRTDLFEAETIARMLRHYECLLESILQQPDAAVADLNLIPVPERQQIVDFNRTEEDYPRDLCLHELFEQQAARNPHWPAVMAGSDVLTYEQLNEKANQVARFLQTRGIGRESRVALCLERNPTGLVGLLGILKAGATYVPIEPDEPAQRFAFKLHNAKVSAVVTTSAWLTHLPLRTHSNQQGTASRESEETTTPRVICLDRDWPAIARQPTANLPALVQPTQSAYLIFTSGSTGAPKGVVVEHRPLVSHAHTFCGRFGLSEADRVLQFAPWSFDVSAEEIFPALAAGSTLVLRPAELAASLDEFQNFITGAGVTVVNLPTPYWAQWVADLRRTGQELPPDLRLVIVGSDMVSVEQYEAWQKLNQRGVRWVNAYGTTEAVITSTIFEPDAKTQPLSSVPIGRPCANTAAYVLDSKGRFVPIGVPGELFLGGEELARSYWERSDLTANKFVPDPFRGRPGARMYRTGDLARWRSDGNVEFLGRGDFQVKIRGFRIEPAEIEAALREHPMVNDAAVVARSSGAGEKRLVAYVVLAEETPNFAGRLIEALRQKLPAYMIPAAFLAIPALPLLASGKVDRQALPDPGADRPELNAAYEPPRNALEERLVQAWAGVLGLESVGIHDNFFELGGHSLLAIRLWAEVEQIIGRRLPLGTLFQNPTIAQLADVIASGERQPRRSSPVPVHAQGSRPPLYLVHGAGGGMLWGYANLSRHLGADQPVYFFNSRGMDGLEEFETVEAIAAQYVSELRAFQKTGPYSLGGYCFGGEIAYEMARQLQAQGESVAFLALMNCTPPNSSYEHMRWTPGGLLGFAANSTRWFKYFVQWTPEQRKQFFRRKFRNVKKQVLRRGTAAVDAKAKTVDAEDFVDLSFYPDYQRDLWSVHLSASARYRPGTYAGHVHLLRSRTHPVFSSFAYDCGWSEYALGGVTVRLLPGAHETILDEPYVKKVAAVLRECQEASLQSTRNQAAA